MTNQVIKQRVKDMDNVPKIGESRAKLFID